MNYKQNNFANMMSQCFLGIGSNLDNPTRQLLLALSHINKHSNIELIKTSKFYLSNPQGKITQPNYVNCAVLISTNLTANKLLEELQKIEILQKKRKNEHWGPRIIDIDILLYLDNRVINSPKLQVPHPLLVERDFVLYPLKDLKPDLILPNNLSIDECLISCKTKYVYNTINAPKF